MQLPEHIQAEIRELFPKTEGVLSDAEVQAIADNLVSFVFHMGGEAR